MINSSFIKNDFLKEYLMMGTNNEQASHKIPDGAFEFC